jgi:hypothetical protein
VGFIQKRRPWFRLDKTGFCTIAHGKRDRTKNDSLDEKFLIEGRPIATCVAEPKLFTYSGSGSDFEKVSVPDLNPDPDHI